ncbi:MAG: class I SAM-dependent methyltransferase [Armatimonadia bacterium]
MPVEKPWHEDDEFWAFIQRRFFAGPERWEQAVHEVDRIVAATGISPGAAVLDLCCGPGRHSLELARRGFRVTGVDRTACYLEQAREQAAGEGLDVEFVEADMREFSRDTCFDAAINMFSSFGYFEDPADDRRVVDNLWTSLRPGGKLLIDTMGKEVLARLFTPSDWQRSGDVICLSERTIERDWTWIRNHQIFLRGDERREFEMDHRLYSAAELKALLADCGFHDIACHGSLDGAPYDQDAKRLIMLAVKSG